MTQGFVRGKNDSPDEANSSGKGDNIQNYSIKLVKPESLWVPVIILYTIFIITDELFRSLNQSFDKTCLVAIKDSSQNGKTPFYSPKGQAE